MVSAWHRLSATPTNDLNARGKNGLEWLAARGVPDGAIAVLFALLLAFTATPYLGGRSIWLFGSSPVPVPPVSERVFWVSVILAPVFWCFMLLRWSGPRITNFLVVVCCAAVAAFLAADFNKRVPSMALGHLRENFHNSHGIAPQLHRPSDDNYAFGGRAPTANDGWEMSSNGGAGGGRKGRWCYFRTPAIPIDDSKRQSNDGTLRVDQITIESTGAAHVTGEGGFDLEVFVFSDNPRQRHDSSLSKVSRANAPRSATPIPSTVKPATGQVLQTASRQPDVGGELQKCTDNPDDITADEPKITTQVSPGEVVDPEKPHGVIGHIVFKVPQNAVGKLELMDYNANIDFDKNLVDSTPPMTTSKTIYRRDVIRAPADSKIQFYGHTEWGSPAYFRMDQIVVNVNGRLQQPIGLVRTVF